MQRCLRDRSIVIVDGHLLRETLGNPESWHRQNRKSCECSDCLEAAWTDVRMIVESAVAQHLPNILGPESEHDYR